MIITGAKLGNDFKWSSIKNNTNYEQERDRTTVYEANVRSTSTIDQLGAGNEHAGRNTATHSCFTVMGIISTVNEPDMVCRHLTLKRKKKQG